MKNMIVWMEKYNLAKIYFEHYGNLKVPQKFKTKNGYEYDKDGINLGMWVNVQRYSKDKGKYRLNDTQIELLNQIGMIWNGLKNDMWMEKYSLAKIYFEHYGNLDIPFEFKTVNGYEYDEDGICIGRWIKYQRMAFNNMALKISDEHVWLLNDIEMNWNNRMDQWMDNYKLTKAYYDYHGNSNIPQLFKTKNGYEYDEDGINLGRWFQIQRLAFNNRGGYIMTPKKAKLLKAIKINIQIEGRRSWDENYALSKAYYEHYGNLEIPLNFKTINGYEYDKDGGTPGMWIRSLRQAFKGKSLTRKITPEQIKSLDQINMTWFMRNSDLKLQKEEITLENLKRKKIEILNRFYSSLSIYDSSELPSKDSINKSFQKKLEIKK